MVTQNKQVNSTLVLAADTSTKYWSGQVWNRFCGNLCLWSASIFFFQFLLCNYLCVFYQFDVNLRFEVRFFGLDWEMKWHRSPVNLVKREVYFNPFIYAKATNNP